MSSSTLGDLLKKEGILSDEETAPSNFLDTGLPNLNKIITGDIDKGLPSGRIIEIMGKSSSGKTMLSTQIMKSAQEQDGFAVFYDHEYSYDSRLSAKQGMDLTASKFLYKEGESFEGSIVHAQKVARIIRENKAIPDTAPIVMVFDSLAAMVPLSKLGKDVDEYTMNDHTALARATSAVFPAFNKNVRELNICAIFLNQLRDTMDMYGPKSKSAGGNAPGFYASIRIELSGTEVKEKGALIRKNMVAKTKKNKLYRPQLETNLEFNFHSDGSGTFDVISSYIDYLKEINVIKAAGPRVEWEGGKPYLSEVKTKVKEMPNGLEFLKKLHKESGL